MNTNEIISAISSVGFPIVCCGILMWYVFKTNNQNREDINSLNEKYQTQIDKVTEALNNNTLALQRLCDKFSEKVDD